MHILKDSTIIVLYIREVCYIVFLCYIETIVYSYQHISDLVVSLYTLIWLIKQRKCPLPPFCFFFPHSQPFRQNLWLANLCLKKIDFWTIEMKSDVEIDRGDYKWVRNKQRASFSASVMTSEIALKFSAKSQGTWLLWRTSIKKVRRLWIAYIYHLASDFEFALAISQYIKL